MLFKWDFSRGEIRVASPRGKPAATESGYPTYGACWMFLCLHNPPNSDMDYGIFNVRTDVNACDCARGCTNTIRESALKDNSGRKIPGRTGESNLRQHHSGPMLYQLSYIPVPIIRQSFLPINSNSNKNNFLNKFNAWNRYDLGIQFFFHNNQISPAAF